MKDSVDYWYDPTSAVGQTTDPADNTDMISPAFWLVNGTEFKITRSDDPSHTALLHTTGGVSVWTDIPLQDDELRRFQER